jgi:hypothetical protein
MYDSVILEGGVFKGGEIRVKNYEISLKKR